MTGKQPQPERVPVTPEEIKASYAVPAPGANKFVVTLGQPGVRIAFGEVHQDLKVPAFHSAVTLHPLDAITLYRVLQDILGEIETQFEAQGLVKKRGSQDGGA